MIALARSERSSSFDLSLLEPSLGVVSSYIRSHRRCLIESLLWTVPAKPTLLTNAPTCGHSSFSRAQAQAKSTHRILVDATQN